MDNLHKLSALDAGFLYSETARCPQHVASVQVMELPDGVAPDAFVDGLKRFLLDRIHLVPYLTNKLQPVALDLARHRLVIPLPGGRPFNSARRYIQLLVHKNNSFDCVG